MKRPNKTNVLRFRCTENTKKIIEKKAEFQGLSLSAFMEKKLMATDDTIDDSAFSSEPVHFFMPDQLGIEVSFFGDHYFLIDGNIRLTDSFLDELLFINEYEIFPKEYHFAGRDDYADPIALVFEADKLTAVRNGISSTYAITFNTFFTSFVDNVKKYSLYYVAPCNYKAIMLDNFDKMVMRMEKYREKETLLLKKLSEHSL